MKIYISILFLLLFLATKCENVNAKIDYDDLSDNGRENNFEDLAFNAENQLKNDAAPSARENFEVEKNENFAALPESTRFRKDETPRSKTQRKVNDEMSNEKSNAENVDYTEYENENVGNSKRESYTNNDDNDASMEIAEKSKNKKAFATDDSNSNEEEFNNSDDTLASENDHSQNNDAAVKNFIYPIKHAKRRFSSNNKLIRSERNDKSTSRNNAKQSTDLTKRKVNQKEKLKSGKFKEKYVEDVKRKADSKETLNDCPTRTLQSNLNSELPVKNSFIKKKVEKFKRNNRNWSQDQLNALSYSLSKIRDDSSEFENLKNILYDMGLASNMQNDKKRDADLSKEINNNDVNREDLKRNIEEEAEDEDMMKNNIILRRNEAINNKNSNWESNQDEAAEGFTKREANTEDEAQSNDMNPKIEPISKFDNKNNKLYMKRSNDAKLNEARSKRQEAQSNADVKSEVENNEDQFEESQNNKNNIVTELSNKRKKRNDAKKDAYQKRVEDQIQAKIDAIKEKVKREIERQKQSNTKQKKEIISGAGQELEEFERKRREIKKSDIVKKSDEVNQEQLKVIPTISKFQEKFLRKKRANRSSDKLRNYRPYQDEQENDMELEEEFNGDPEDTKMFLDKRQTNDESQYYEPNERDSENYEGPMKMYQNRKRRRYLDNALTEDDSQYQEDMIAQKRADDNYDDRDKRGHINKEQSENEKLPENNENAAENEYFGPLPEAYDSELSRYKRVKRDHLKSSPNKK